MPASAEKIPIPSSARPGGVRPDSMGDLPLHQEISHEQFIEVQKDAEELEPRRIKLNIVRRRSAGEAPSDPAEEAMRKPRGFSGKLSNLLKKNGVEPEVAPEPAETAPVLPEAQAERKEQTPLDLARRTYGEADRRAAEVYRKLSNKDRKAGIRDIEEAVARRKFTSEDRLWLAGYGSLAEDAASRRDSFISELQSMGLEETQAHAVYAKEIARLEYEAKKSERKRELYSEEPVLKEWEQKLNRPRDQWTPDEVLAAMSEADERTKPEILDFILRERELLQKTCLDRRGAVEPLQKGVEAVKACMDWWMAKPKSVRLVGSTLAFTLLHASTSGTAGLALFAGKRLLRSLAAAGLAQIGAGLTGKAGDKLYKIKEREAEIESLRRESHPLDDEFEKKFLQLHDELGKDKRKIALVKMAVMIGTGYASAYGMQEIHEMASGDGVSSAVAKAKDLAGAAADAFEEVKAPPPPAAPELNVPAPPVIMPAEQAEAAFRKIESATIQKGEGIWHAVERQVSAEVKLNPEKYGLSQTDMSDPEKIGAAVDRETGRLLAKEDLLDRGGAEAGTKAVVDFDRSEIALEGKTWVPAEAGYDNFRNGYLERMGFADKASYETLGSVKIGDILGQTDRAIASYPENWRHLAEVLRENGVTQDLHDLTLDEYLRREFLLSKGSELPVSVPAAETVPEPPRMEAPPSETSVRPGYMESVMTKHSLGPALERQLVAHLGNRYAALPDGTRAEIAGFLKEITVGDKNILKVDFDRLAPGDKVNFGPLFDNKELLNQAFEFPREAEILDRLHFAPEQIFDGSYVRVIRNMPISDYLEAFQKGSHNGFYDEYGMRKILEHGGTMTSFYVDEGHVELAKLIEKNSLIANNRDLTVAQFLKKFGSDSLYA